MHHCDAAHVSAWLGMQEEWAKQRAWAEYCHERWLGPGVGSNMGQPPFGLSQCLQDTTWALGIVRVRQQPHAAWATPPRRALLLEQPKQAPCLQWLSCMQHAARLPVMHDPLYIPLCST